MYQAQEHKGRVFVLYEGDPWLSTSSLNVRAVCDTFENAVNLAVAHYYGTDDIEDVERELRENAQYLGDGFGYMIQYYDLNEWQ